MRNDPLRPFGHKIRERRHALGLSQEALSHKAGLDRTYVSGVERGERNIGLRNIVKLARALETEPGKLLRDIS